MADRPLSSPTKQARTLSLDDWCFGIVVGKWAGFGRVNMKGVRVRGVNIGWVGLRWWRGDLPHKIVVEAVRLAEAAVNEAKESATS